MLAFTSLPAALQAGSAPLAARTAGRAAPVRAQLQFGPPPVGFEWGYSTLDSVWADAAVTNTATAASAAPAPAENAQVEPDVYDSRSTTQTQEQSAAAAPESELSQMSVPDACKFMADPSLDGMLVADKSAYLAFKGVDAFVIAQASCVAPEDNVQGHPELPAAAVVEGQMSVPDACVFMADPSLDGMSVADKSAYLASKGVDAFVIAQASCVAPEDNVQGHPELPAAAVVEGQMSVPDACLFMADSSLDGMSVADKSAYLASKGVTAFVIAQASCVAPEDNVQGHPELVLSNIVPAAGVKSWYDAGLRL